MVRSKIRSFLFLSKDFQSGTVWIEGWLGPLPPMYATCSIHLIPLHFPTLIFYDEYKL
jgi:hypothetical protein